MDENMNVERAINNDNQNKFEIGVWGRIEMKQPESKHSEVWHNL
jgi:hypothetical protein